MKFSVFVSAILFVSVFVAQNLVPNPSFETITSCPIGPGAITHATGWSNPDTATADLFNVCNTGVFPLPSLSVPSNLMGSQNARTGDGYAGIICNEVVNIPFFPSVEDDYREYIQVQLTAPLVAGVEYDIEFYWSLSENSTHYVEELGVYFSNTVTNLQQSTALNLTPQVSVSGTPLNETTNWVLFSETYIATGGEEYIIIGNFNNPNNTTSGSTGVTAPLTVGGDHGYYYIDDVSVKEATCFEIEKILVNACGTEGHNEMVTFRVGNQDLNSADLNVVWATANSYDGIIQNAATQQLTLDMNNAIAGCGHLIEPTGGVLPAGREILLITSTVFNQSLHSFASLNDTLIVIYHNSTVSQGYFTNYTGSSSLKSLQMSFSSPGGCSDQVTYDRSLLVEQDRVTLGNEDGAFVSFTPDGTATYDNLGCQIITGVLDINITSDMLSVCGGETITLNAEIEGGDYSEILWSAQHGTFSVNNELSTTLAVNNNVSSSFYIYGSVIKYGCNGNINDTITDSIQITMGVAPTVSVVASSNLLCTGQTVTLTASGADTYLWSNGSTANPLVITTGGSYSVTGTNGCGSDNDAVTISEMQAPLPIIVPSPMYSCDSNELHQVDLSTNVCDNCTYTWSDGSTGTQYSGNEPNYSVTIQNSCGTYTANYNYNVITVLADIFVQDSIGNAPFTVPFSSVSSSGSYSWDFDNGNIIEPWFGTENPIETFVLPGEYLVSLTVSELGCTATAYQTIIVEGSLLTEAIIPNIFSPNGDGENDAFFIETINGSAMSGSIFNRWGRKVHELNGLDAKWTGGNQSEGTYFYIIEVTFVDGTTKEYEGSLMLVK